jgi:hypothetical protein
LDICRCYYGVVGNCCNYPVPIRIIREGIVQQNLDFLVVWFFPRMQSVGIELDEPFLRSGDYVQSENCLYIFKLKPCGVPPGAGKFSFNGYVLGSRSSYAPAYPGLM